MRRQGQEAVDLHDNPIDYYPELYILYDRVPDRIAI